MSPSRYVVVIMVNVTLITLIKKNVPLRHAGTKEERLLITLDLGTRWVNGQRPGYVLPPGKGSPVSIG
jgi:hypothetical protein